MVLDVINLSGSFNCAKKYLHDCGSFKLKLLNTIGHVIRFYINDIFYPIAKSRVILATG